MTCMEFSGLVCPYVDGTLPADQLPGFYSHAVECRECLTYLRNYRRVVALLKEERRTV